MSACAEALRVAFLNNCDTHARRDSLVEVVVDFENAVPTESELETYELAASVMGHSADILLNIAAYGKGATDYIRDAISYASDERAQSDCWAQVLKQVARLKMYYEFSMRLEQIVPLLLLELGSGPLPALEQLEAHQALTKQFAEVLQFTLRFDEIKMSTPAIQNDFSYYRRTMSKDTMAYAMDSEQPEALVSMELANTLSFFFADPTPMLSCVKRATEQFVKQNVQVPVEHTTDTLCTIARVCRSMLDQPALSELVQRDTHSFCMRVMTAAVILYDHVHPVGAFARNSQVNMRAVVRLLLSCRPQSESLLNALRYTSKHAMDANTPKSIKYDLQLINQQQ